MVNEIRINDIKVGGENPLIVIAGPCVIENYETTYEIASFLKKITSKLEMPFIFKASFDKANRTSIDSFRGLGVATGLEILNNIKTKLDLNIISDVHEIGQIEAAKDVLDVIQIPAFLCRQTDLIIRAAETNKTINIKKGQFMSPKDIKNSVEKARSTGNNNIFLTERGSSFGYNNLVVDFRGIEIMHKTANCPVIFDATHSVQLPGGAGLESTGESEYAPILAKSAVAAGCDGVFFEVHPEPEKALCDGANSLKLNDDFKELLKKLKKIKAILK